MRRVEECIEFHERHFENYRSTLSAINHKLNVSGHMLIWIFVLVLVVGLVPKVYPHLLFSPAYTMFLTLALLPVSSNSLKLYA
jgi:hypothetical protein